MSACGPFERRPVLAVAVSGGLDSMALCLLTAAWAASRKARVVALTVDHALRAESALEALQVGCWLADRRIEHHILRWEDQKPDHGIQAAARAARYRLLGEWCVAHGILHLLIAHHREDQAETYILRAGRGSGPVGLSGMREVSRLPLHLPDAPLLLRPLLGVSKSALRKNLEQLEQGWIEDPSNRNEKFERVRIRQNLNDPAAIVAALEAASGMEETARGRETELAEFLALHSSFDPAGYASFDRAAFLCLSRPVAVLCLARLGLLIAGRIYPPRSERLERLYSVLAAHESGGWTLGGCLIECAAGKVSLFREQTNCIQSVGLASGEQMIWDGRFRVSFTSVYYQTLTVAKLGAAGWRKLVAANSQLRGTALPYAVRLGLPAFFHEDEPVAVPHLGYWGKGGNAAAISRLEAEFCPARGLL